MNSRTRATSQKDRESDDKNAVAIVNVSQLGCVSQDSDALVSQGRKSLGNLIQKVWEPIQRVRFTKSTLRQASIREKKGLSLEKINLKALRQPSPYAVKFEDRSHEETERQQRCARSKAWNLAKNIYKLKEIDKATFYFHTEEWVLPAASTKEPEERRVCGGFGSQYAYGQQARPQLCGVGDHEDIEESDDGDDGQRRGANK